MENLLFLLPLLFLVACPLTMGAMGVGVWLIARARGQKKELSMGCMGGGQCDHKEHAGQDQQQPADQVQEGTLEKEVAHLRREVQTLRAQVGTSGNGATGADELVAAPGQGEGTVAPAPAALEEEV
jgi:hypothetical protein